MNRALVDCGQRRPPSALSATPSLAWCSRQSYRICSAQTREQSGERKLVSAIKAQLLLLAIDAFSLGYLFAGLGLMCMLLIWFFIPDFTGRSYAQIDELFLRKIPARKFVSTECTGNYGRDVTDGDIEVVAAR